MASPPLAAGGETGGRENALSHFGRKQFQIERADPASAYMFLGLSVIFKDMLNYHPKATENKSETCGMIWTKSLLTISDLCVSSAEVLDDSCREASLRRQVLGQRQAARIITHLFYNVYSMPEGSS